MTGMPAASRLSPDFNMVTWRDGAQKVGLLSLAETRELQRRAEETPSAAGAILDRAIILREAIYRISLRM